MLPTSAGEQILAGRPMSSRARNIAFTLCGVAGLVLKGRYRGPNQIAVHSYWGNIAASFAVYFILANLPFCMKFGRLVTAGCAFAVVGLFEVTNGFHVMTNTYDPIDHVANAVGIALALLADAVSSWISFRPKKKVQAA
jgi:hypothetical protein